MTDFSEYITTAELAKRLSRSEATCKRWRRERRCGPPYIRLPSGRVVYDPAKVAAWLDSHTIDASH